MFRDEIYPMIIDDDINSSKENPFNLFYNDSSFIFSKANLNRISSATSGLSNAAAGLVLISYSGCNQYVAIISLNVVLGRISSSVFVASER